MNILRIPKILNFLRETQNPAEIVASYIKGDEMALQMKDGGTIKAHKGEGRLSLLAEAKNKGYKVLSYRDNYFILEKDEMKIIGSNWLAIEEEFEYYSSFEGLKGDKVLDIGGFMGETALKFIKKSKCSDVIVYEALNERAQIIEEMSKLNGIEDNIQLVNKAVGCFGEDTSMREGEKEEVGSSVSWNKAIEHGKSEGVYLVKIDCEGCESGLTDVEDKKLREIPNWVMETHSSEIRKNLREKFEAAGFETEILDKRERTLEETAILKCEL